MSTARPDWIQELDRLAIAIQKLASETPFGYARFGGMLKRTKVEDLDGLVEELDQYEKDQI